MLNTNRLNTIKSLIPFSHLNLVQIIDRLNEEWGYEEGETLLQDAYYSPIGKKYHLYVLPIDMSANFVYKSIDVDYMYFDYVEEENTIIMFGKESLIDDEDTKSVQEMVDYIANFFNKGAIQSLINPELQSIGKTAHEPGKYTDLIYNNFTYQVIYKK